MEIQSQEINHLIESLSKAQGEISVAIYDSKNPHFKSNYASYESIRKACVGPLSKYGLSITHHLQLSPDGKRMMVTQLSHISGQWLRSFLILPQEKETPHGVGSSITYAKRYTLGALLAISSDEDDDGQKAEEENKSERKIPIFIEEEQAEDILSSFKTYISPYDPEYLKRALEAVNAKTVFQIQTKDYERMMKNIDKKMKKIEEENGTTE